MISKTVFNKVKVIRIFRIFVTLNLKTEVTFLGSFLVSEILFHQALSVENFISNVHHRT